MRAEETAEKAADASKAFKATATEAKNEFRCQHHKMNFIIFGALAVALELGLPPEHPLDRRLVEHLLGHRGERLHDGGRHRHLPARLEARP